jgi:hypothetical protein
VGGGQGNSSHGLAATIPGGSFNYASGAYGFAAGRRARALHDGAFVWADAMDADFSSTQEHEFNVRASGGVRFITWGAGMTLDGLPILAGTVGSSQLGGTYPNAVTFNNPGNSFSGSGANLTGLNAGALTSGTVADARLSSNVALRNAANTFTGNQVVNGRLGINASPAADLHVKGQGTNGMVLITPNTSDSRSQIMLSENVGGTLGMILRYDGDVGSNPFHVVGRYSGGVDTELVTIERNGGNVGIGTNNPTARLEVNGTALAPQFKATSQAPSGSSAIGEYRRDNSVVAWGKVQSAGTLLHGYNVASVTHTGTGIYTINLHPSFQSNGSYAITVTPELDAAPASAAELRIASANQDTASSFQVFLNRGDGPLVDGEFMFTVTGR